MNEDSFYSIDRLIDFGMGISIAQQMVRTMNESMRTMHVSGMMNPMNSQQLLYYAIINEKQTGPFSESELAKLISDKKIVNQTYVWKTGLTNWVLAESLPEILKIVALTPPPFIQ